MVSAEGDGPGAEAAPILVEREGPRGQPPRANKNQSAPLRLVLTDDELTAERIEVLLDWSKGTPARLGSRRDDIDSHHLALLLCAARQQLKGEDFCGADEVRAAYANLCEDFKREPRSRPTVYRMLLNLEAKRYVEVIRRGSGRASLIFVMGSDRVKGHREPSPKADVELLEPLAVTIVDGKPWCPTCHQDLSDDGAVNWPAPDFANLTVDPDGKVRVNDVQKSEGDTKSAECSACGQRLQSKGWWS